MNSTVSGNFYLANRKTILMYKISAALSFPLALVSFMVGGAGFGPVLTIGIVSVVMITTSQKPVLTFFDSHAEFKATGFAPLVIIRYERISHVSSDKKFIYLGQPTEKDVKIRRNLFSAEDIPEIISSFEEIIQNRTTQTDSSIQKER